jgi:hypothetical protein
MTSSSIDSEKTPALSVGIKKHIESERLDDAQLKELLSMQQAVLGLDSSEPSQDKIIANHKRRTWFGALAACLFVTVIIFLNENGGMPGVQNMPKEIAMEVVKNHLKLKPLDVKASSMRDIQEYFTQLDFLPLSSSVASRHFSLPVTQLLGGRYCSIQGVTAAQLRYQRNDSLSTLYEVAYDSATFGTLPNMENNEQPLELLIKGLKVAMWVEKGLLMVLVSNE